MDLILIEGYMITFSIKLRAEISNDNYYSPFYHPFDEFVQCVIPSTDLKILPYSK
jgi:hypothetical protein